ncbi:His Kinase A (phospho-acceptor) domain-containing protein [Candidatus Electrothrix communis]|uniref:histidine kinase n=1 Tax=Candidatus Electrothrix communis TaxID=1859133 RepID=A0A3S3UFX1_9BACT|nr:His Kinase A (phospho-acceptor) domain-containing protein [Candidatus Electrothrix communis]
MVEKKKIKGRNEDLIVAKEKVEERSKDLALASKYKSEFLANMSHELRTPLNSLLLLSQSLKENREGNLTEKQEKAAGIIFESGNDLLDLINEILDLSKIEAGQIVKDVEEVLLTDLAENAETLFSHMAQNKGVAFSITLADDVPPSIFTDRKRVEQILKNFLGNSMKFTSEGRIDLVFSRMEQQLRFDRRTCSLSRLLQSLWRIQVSVSRLKNIGLSLKPSSRPTVQLLGSTAAPALVSQFPKSWLHSLVGK